MVMQAAADQHLVGVWLILLFAAAGVFHHAGIKIPFFAFYAHDSGIRCKEAPINMLVAMGISSFLCIFIGCFPGFLYDMLPYAVAVALAAVVFGYVPVGYGLSPFLGLALASLALFGWLRWRGRPVV